MLARFRETTEANALARRFGVVFDPTVYGTLVLWLDAADVSGTGTNPSNGTAITSWKDKSGLAKHATNVGSPVLDSTGVNSKPGILLNGTSMGFGGALANTGTVSTTFVVATLNTGTSTNGRLVSLARATDPDYNQIDTIVPLMRNLSGQGLRTDYTDTARSQVSVPTYDTPFYATSVVNGTNNINYVNGVAGTTSAMSATFAIAKYGIGKQANANGDYWKGYVSEVLIYNSALSTANRQAVESYLATKWSI